MQLPCAVDAAGGPRSDPLKANHAVVRTRSFRPHLSNFSVLIVYFQVPFAIVSDLLLIPYCLRRPSAGCQ